MCKYNVDGKVPKMLGKCSVHVYDAVKKPILIVLYVWSLEYVILKLTRKML